VSATCTLNDAAVTRARVHVPAWGVWWADVDTTTELALEKGAVATLVLADVTLTGVVVDGGVYEGRAAYRIMGGRGGWARTVRERGYVDDAGVKLSKVLGDLATEVGETLSGVSATTRLGPHYARRADVASRVLNWLAPSAWYVDFAGVTHMGARAATTYTGDAPRVRVGKADRVVELAPEVLAPFVPGVQVDGSLPATDIEFSVEGSKLAVRVYAGSRSTRRLDALKRLIGSLYPQLQYQGVYEFRVVTQSGERLDLQPVRVASGLPQLSNVPVRPGVAGFRSNVRLGELVLVVFVDCDPSRPVVIAHDAPDAVGWMPLLTEFGGPGALGVARLTDPVQAGPFAGVVTGASARFKSVL
jgi:hypothetical protein